MNISVPPGAGAFPAFSVMPNSHPKDPLHGLTLERILTELVDHYGWEELGRLIDIRCFNFDPSIKSSLTFLRKTPWARKKVEALYLWAFPPGVGSGEGNGGPCEI